MTQRSDEEQFRMDLRLLQRIAQTGQVHNRMHTTARLVEIAGRMKRDRAELLKLREVAGRLRELLQEHTHDMAALLASGVDSNLHHPLIDALADAEAIYHQPVPYLRTLEITTTTGYISSGTITDMEVAQSYERDYAGVRGGSGGERDDPEHQQEVVVDSTSDPTGRLPRANPSGDTDSDEAGLGSTPLRDASEAD